MMLKNRETISNPYHVPKQPTANWVKFCIGGLVLSNIALIAGLALVILPNKNCLGSCTYNVTALTEELGRSEGKIATNEKTVYEKQTNVMPRDEAYGVLRDLDTKVRMFSERLTYMEGHLSSKVSLVDELEEKCKSCSRPPKVPSSGVATRSPDRPDPSGISQKVASMEVELSKLSTRLSGHIRASSQMCNSESHLYFESSCFYVAETEVSQPNAKELCAAIDDANGVLAIIKDKFLQEFLSTMRLDQEDTYWIGIERVKPKEEQSSSRSHHRFEYLDGNKVQNDVWEMWMPSHRGQETGHDCVAVKYDSSAGKWFWKGQDCNDGFGYVCQYFPNNRSNM